MMITRIIVIIHCWHLFRISISLLRVIAYISYRWRRYSWIKRTWLFICKASTINCRKIRFLTRMWIASTIMWGFKVWWLSWICVVFSVIVVWLITCWWCWRRSCISMIIVGAHRFFMRRWMSKLYILSLSNTLYHLNIKRVTSLHNYNDDDDDGILIAEQRCSNGHLIFYSIWSVRV